MKNKNMTLRFIGTLFLTVLSFYVLGQADAGEDKAICKGESTQIGTAGNGANCYKWKPEKGLDDPTSPTPMANPMITTTYTLTVIGENFTSKNSDKVEVKIVEIDKIQYEVNSIWKDIPGNKITDICLGSSIKFKVILTEQMPKIPNEQIKWSGISNGTGEEINVKFNSSGNQTLTVQCGENSQSINVEVDAANVPKIITWDPYDYVSNNVNVASSAVEKPFVLEYTACADILNNVWKLRVKRVTGDITITVNYGGSRNADTNPPNSQAEASDAVTVMKGYYARGLRGSWHTADASLAHEKHHYDEWQCSSNHYWPDTEICLEKVTVPYSNHATEADAINEMKRTSANMLINNFKIKAHNYWFTLPDNASSRPYAAGQLTLNTTITNVQTLAASKGWSVPAGVNTPNAANPCFKAWLPYTCP